MADRELFEAEAMVWADTVYRAALGLCAQPSLADDLAQSTFLKAWERFDHFEAGTNCRAWLLAILQNTWFDQLRQQNHVDWAASEALDQVAAREERPDPPDWSEADRVIEQFDNDRLISAFSGLPDEFRMALFLVDVEDCTHEEAAGILGVQPGTVKSRTSRARRMIRDRLVRPENRLEGQVVEKKTTDDGLS